MIFFRQGVVNFQSVNDHCPGGINYFAIKPKHEKPRSSFFIITIDQQSPEMFSRPCYSAIKFPLHHPLSSN